jgi:hypothetical protein
MANLFHRWIRMFGTMVHMYPSGSRRLRMRGAEKDFMVLSQAVSAQGIYTI